MSRASYSIWGVRGGVVYIVDQHSTANPTMSITNDAEAVVGEVQREYPGAQIVYRDTDGQWDELKHVAGIFKGFGSWHGWTPEENLFD